jgi:SIR2-like domain
MQARNPLWVAQQVVQSDESLRSPMMAELARHLQMLEAAATLTPALLALANTPNRAALILTLNYDLLIEQAAVQNGREVQTLGVADIPRLLMDELQEPGETLRVLHLHGSLLDPPDELVLDAVRYSSRAGDQRVRDLFGTLLAYYNLCVIGSSFEEQYLATVLLALRPEQPRHVIVCDEPVADRIFEGSAQLTTTVHNVLVCDYPRGDHQVLDGFCEELIHCLPEPPSDTLALPARAAVLDELYEPRRFLDGGEQSESAESQEIAVALGVIDAFAEEDLRAERRAVLVGAPGAGKSRLFEHLAASPAQGERGVLIRLRNVRDALGEPAGLIARWVAAGEVLDGGRPVLVESVLSGEVRVHLLLDGLDELPRETREQLAGAIVAVGKAMPDQRITVSSRPSAILEVFPQEWRRLTLLCDASWLSGLLARAGTDQRRLAEQLGDLYPAVEPLLSVPFFLRGLLDLLDEDHVPEDGLGLVLALLRRQLRQDERLEAFGTSVERWLTRVALSMLLSTASTISDEALTSLAAGLGLGDPPMLAEVLASRSLLLESAARYSFQHRLFAEALMAEFLLGERPEDWLDVLAPSSGGHSSLREDYQGMASMLLARSSDWRSVIAGRDPRAAARSTPPSAPEEERSRAAWLLWNRAQRLDVWIDPSRLEATRSDGEIVSRLIRAGGLADLRAEVRASVERGSRFQRGNAIDVLAGAHIEGVEPLLRRVLVEDGDPVLLRSAAGAARRLKLKGLLGPIERRTFGPGDKSETGDLGWAALELAPPGERLALAVRLDANNSGSIREWSLLGALGPADQLSLLAIRARMDSEMGRASEGAERLERVLAALETATKRQAAQVALVAAIAKVSSASVVEFLGSHPEGAVGLLDAIDEQRVESWEIPELLRAVGPHALERHGASSQVLALFAPPEAQPVVRPAPLPRHQPSAEIPQPARTVEEILAVTDRRQLLRALHELGQLASEVANAPTERRDRLAAELDELWGERDLRDAIDVRGTEATVQGWGEAILRIGPELHWQLSEVRWIQAALCGWLYQPQLVWLAEQAQPGRASRATAEVPSGPSLADLVEIGAPEDLPAVVDEILARDPGALPEIKLESVAMRLAETRPDLLARLAEHDPALEPLAGPRLAAGGDLDAQRAMLERLIETLATGERPGRRDTEWLGAVSDRALFEPLTRAISLAGGERAEEARPHEDVLMPLQAAAERADPQATLELYEQQIADPPWFGAQFVIYRREALVQRLISEPGEQAARAAAARLGLPVAIN